MSPPVPTSPDCELYCLRYGIPYVPTISAGFDSSPRTLPSDGWPASMAEMRGFGYPWTKIFMSDIPQWRAALQQSRDAIAELCRERRLAAAAAETAVEEAEAEAVAVVETAAVAAAAAGRRAVAGWCPPLLINAWNEWCGPAFFAVSLPRCSCTRALPVSLPRLSS